MAKEMLGYCDNCKESSITAKMYNPVKPIPVQYGSSIIFSRVSYCVNQGCGWRRKWPDVEVYMKIALDKSSKGINSYLRRAQQKFPGLKVKSLWTVWVHLNVEEFEEYLQEMKDQKNA